MQLKLDWQKWDKHTSSEGISKCCHLTFSIWTTFIPVITPLIQAPGSWYSAFMWQLYFKNKDVWQSYRIKCATEAQTSWPFQERQFLLMSVICWWMTSHGVIWLKDVVETSCTYYLSNYVIYYILVHYGIYRRATYSVCQKQCMWDLALVKQLVFGAGLNKCVSPPLFLNQCVFTGAALPL